jgi:ABC-type transport system substrate-binding protein
MFYTNAEVDRLLDQGRTETDPVRREDIYFRVQQIVHDEAPWISQWFGETVHGLGPNVRGFRLHPTGTDRWQTIYFE